MTDVEARKWLRGIVNQRLYLIRTERNHKNKQLMIGIATRLDALLKTYTFKGDKIFDLVQRHKVDIMMIIPANNAEQKNYQTLNTLLLCDPMNRNSLTSTRQPLPTQLQLQLS